MKLIDCGGVSLNFKDDEKQFFGGSANTFRDCMKCLVVVVNIIQIVFDHFVSWRLKGFVFTF